MNEPHVVLVPGSFVGLGTWRYVESELDKTGVPVTVVRLPSSTIANGLPGGDLYDDAAHVRATLDALAGPVLLCGHSYGGAVITEAAAGPHLVVSRLVYLAAAIPNVGESLADLAPVATESEEDAGGESVRFREDGMIELAAESARASLFHDCSADRIEEAIAELVPSNPAVGSQPVRAAAWHDIPATVVRGTADRMPELVSSALPFQQLEKVELPAGHCPQWSQPREVAALLAARVG